MQALILDDDCRRQVALSMALSRAGFQLGCAASYRVAEACIRQGTVDLLIMPERLRGRLTHALALLAEWRSPAVATLMMSDREGPEVEELYLLLPSLHALMPCDVRPADVAGLAISAVTAAAERAASGGRLVLEEHLRIDAPQDARSKGATAGPHAPAEPATLVFSSCRACAAGSLVTAA